MKFEMKIKCVGGSYSSFIEACVFQPFNDFTNKGPNIWQGFVNNCKIVITQKDYKSEISEDNISFEPKIGCGIMTQRSEIVTAFNDYIADIYR